MAKENSSGKNIKVAVVGAGFSGLVSAVYAAKSGFDVTVFEQHYAAGGLSAGWKRKSYKFEGGMHWLTGSNSRIPLNQIWVETGALKENNPVTYRDPVYTVLDGEKNLCFHRDIEKFRRELLEHSPEDKKAINRLVSDVKLFCSVIAPVTDIPGVKIVRGTKGFHSTNLWEFMKMAPAGLRYGALCNESSEKYISRFKNRKIRHLLNSVNGYRYNALSLIFTIAGFAMGDYGFPKGGSDQMTANMIETLKSLGGRIEFRSKVEKVMVKEGKACGVIVKGEEIPFDAVIVSQDAARAVDELFETPLDEQWIRDMKRDNITEQNMYIGLGVKTDLSALPDCFICPLESGSEFSAGGLKFTELRVNNYAKKRDYSPEGTSVLTCLLLGDSRNYWKELKDKGTYMEEKEAVIQEFVRVLEGFVPEIKGNVEVTDMATPLTYERYCSSKDGSWMSVFLPKGKMFSYPTKSKSVENLYFEGQRLRMPGGLPITVLTAREAVQNLCRDNKVPFMT